jgi:ATP-dependent protease ClpP protease subunit
MTERRKDAKTSPDDEPEGPIEIAIIGDVTDGESDITEKLLSVPIGGQCTIYFDSPGGSPYAALSLTTIMLLRNIDALGIVTGECSSAALWPLAACRRRAVTPHSVLLFHPMKWQSEEHVGLQEAAEWARHFGALERDMDQLLADLLRVDRDLLDSWINPGRYISGREFAEAGLAELVTLGRISKEGSPMLGVTHPCDGNGAAKVTPAGAHSG